MSARITLGGDFTIARNAVPPRSGRMCFVANSLWTTNSTYAYPGFDHTANSVAGNTDFLAALMVWLTGKATGASVLICALDPNTGAFGPAFRAALAGLGHSSTLTGAIHFNGYDPLDFDCVCVFDTYNPPDAFGVAFDAYIDARGAALTFCMTSGHIAPRYGVKPRSSSPFYQTSPPDVRYLGAPDYLMTYPVLFDGAPHYVVQYWAFLIEVVAGSRGGTMTLHNNMYGEPGIATWEA